MRRFYSVLAERSLAFTAACRRHPALCAFIASFAVMLPLFASLLVGRTIYFAGDTLGFIYPSLYALRGFDVASLLTDPFAGRGYPWIVTYGTIDPVTSVLRLLASPPVALAWLDWLCFSSGAWLFALWLRRGGASWFAAFAGGIVFVGAFFWIADGDNAFLWLFPVTSVLLLALQQGREHPILSAAGITAAAAWGWLAGHFNFMPLIMVSLLVYAGRLSLRSAGGWRQRIRPLLAYVVGSLAGTGIGLVKLIPALAYVQLSERAGGLSLAASSTTGTLTPSFLFTALFPYVRLPFIGGISGGLFFGSGALACMLLGAWCGRKMFWPVLLGMVILLLIAAPYSPLYAVIHSLPFFSTLRTPIRWLFVFNILAGVLTAGSIDAIAVGAWVRERRKIGNAFLILGTVFLCIGIVAILTDALAGERIVRWLFELFQSRYYAVSSGLPLSHYHDAIAGMWHQLVENFSPLDKRFLLPLLGLFATGAVVRFETSGSRQRTTAVCTGLVVLTLVPSLAFNHPHVSADPLRDITQRYRESGVGNAYVMPFMPAFSQYLVTSSRTPLSPEEKLSYSLALLIPNMQALVGVRSIDFYQPIQPRRMARLLAALGSDVAPAPEKERLVMEKLPLEEKIRTFAGRAELLSLLNVSSVVSAWELPEPFTFVTAIQPVASLPPVRIYSVPHPRPIIYGAERVERFAPDEDRAMALLRDISDPSLTVIECASCRADAPRRSAMSNIRISEDRDRSLSFTVDASAPGWIVVSRPRLPGWRVSVDGHDVKTAIANGFFFGIPVDGGSHAIRLSITWKTLLEDTFHMLLRKNDPWQLS